MEDQKFELLKDILKILNHDITSLEDLVNITFHQTELRSEELKLKLNSLVPELKKCYNSKKLTCLHKNSLNKQKFPNSNLLRQILKEHKLRLHPYEECKGYVNNKKIMERYYIIVTY